MQREATAHGNLEQVRDGDRGREGASGSCIDRCVLFVACSSCPVTSTIASDIVSVKRSDEYIDASTI